LMYALDQEPAVGWVSLRVQERDTRAAELGYSVVRDRRGQGLATEAARVLVREAFDRLDVNRVRAFCVPENGASRALLRRIGFRDNGLLHNGATVGGQPVDVLAFIFERGDVQKGPS